MTTTGPLRYKLFLTNGISDYVRTAMGEVRLFPSAEEAQRVGLEHGGGLVLPEDAPTPAGFDRMWEP